MIDLNLPMRTRNGTRVYHTGWHHREDGIIWVGLDDRWGNHVTRYWINSGLPYDQTPLGHLANYDPLEDMMKGWEDVVKPVEARRRAEEIAAIEGNDMFGMF